MRYSVKDFHIKIPEELIAQYPYKERGDSRLLVFDLRNNTLKDDYFRNISNYISSNECIIYNDAKVINARIFGVKNETGARIEILLTRKLNELEWYAIVRPARRVRTGTLINVSKGHELEVTGEMGEGLFKVRFSKPVEYKDLENIGEIPLPKYIKRKPVKEIDGQRYQTIFSRKYGAVASPTAGLHFTDRTVNEIKQKGAVFIPVTLHVDWGTFKPVREQDYRDHKIHKEMYEISGESARRIKKCVEEGRRILCVGTTSIRTIETAVDKNGNIRSRKGETSLYIYPGYRFKLIDGMITNFHMPDSTLILLVAAFCGKEGIKRAYNHAISQKYRFFSYGDAMLILKR